MGLLDGTDQQYYQGEDYGNYQFTSLDDIITQFQVAYVGEDKIISKVRRADIAFSCSKSFTRIIIRYIQVYKSPRNSITTITTNGTPTRLR